jgi:hypothetical protein
MKGKTSIIVLIMAVHGNAFASNDMAVADHDYQIFSKGKTMDVVEFTPRNNPNISCTVITSKGQLVMNCFPKGEKNLDAKDETTK